MFVLINLKKNFNIFPLEASFSRIKLSIVEPETIKICWCAVRRRYSFA